MVGGSHRFCSLSALTRCFLSYRRNIHLHSRRIAQPRLPRGDERALPDARLRHACRGTCSRLIALLRFVNARSGGIVPLGEVDGLLCHVWRCGCGDLGWGDVAQQWACGEEGW
jgi:hypothetical protein